MKVRQRTTVKIQYVTRGDYPSTKDAMDLEAHTEMVKGFLCAHGFPGEDLKCEAVSQATWQED